MGRMELPRRTFQFDSLYVLQFLRPDDDPTGEALFEGEIRRAAAESEIHAEIAVVSTREQFLAALDRVIHACLVDGRSPILHLETHGSPRGIMSTPHELVTWEELKPHLTRINELSKVSLLVTLAACHGLHLGKTLRTTDRAPVWALIGPDHQVMPSDVSRCFSAFYREFLTNLELTTALVAMQAADQSNPSTWKIQSAEVFLSYIFGEFLAKASNPARLQQMEDVAVARALREGPLSRVQIRELRTRVYALLRNFDRDFDRMKSRFLMLDRFPENRSRFSLTYEQAVRLHASVKALIAAEAA